MPRAVLPLGLQKDEEEFAMNPERLIDGPFRAHNPVSESITRLIGKVGQAVSSWQRRAHDRAVLASLDDRMLRDIGYSKADVDRECAKPFWKV